jgi:hypothetical protein
VPRPGPEAELALAGPYRRATPPPVPVPGGSPGWPPEQPALGPDWTDPLADLGPPGTHPRWAALALAAAATLTLAVVLVAALV